MRAFYLFVVFITACQFDSGELSNFCLSKNDCLQGESCVEKKCVSKNDDLPDLGDNNDVSIDRDSGVDMVDGKCKDEDGDGYFSGLFCQKESLDCNDSDPLIHPGATEQCNQKDNDCDGELKVDCVCVDGTSEKCGSDVGQCKKGARICVKGEWGECRGETKPVKEICDEVDNNCDGTNNEGCPCKANETMDCGSNVGVCKKGVQECKGGEWTDCIGSVSPGIEICDNKDNDCNGKTDDDPAGVGGGCNSKNLGVCKPGTMECDSGQLVCASIFQPETETCNNKDDNCDGKVDEEVTATCTSACGPGVAMCASGKLSECVPNTRPVEQCDGIDNDCDGMTDESFPEDGLPCDTGVAGVCAFGTYSCKNGSLDCDPLVSPTSETCDGKDNDCDGRVDEDALNFVLYQACNGGGCPNGAWQLCEGGSYGACTHRDFEQCNGSDSNCDGLNDNKSACYMACPGGGIAMGTQTCSSNAPHCELPEEICGDGIDNDCDGLVDQNCLPSVENMAFVPAGIFMMGGNATDRYASSDEFPLHSVDLSAFYMDREEVSRFDYALCIQNGPCTFPKTNGGCPNQTVNINAPIVCINHSQAKRYCKWVGKRLPTEAEWEKAARGPFQGVTIYPWGNQEDLSRTQMECFGGPGACLVDTSLYNNGKSYYGILNLSGNASEMVQDFYDPNFYGPGIVSDPFNGFSNLSGHVVRGGDFSEAIQNGRVSKRKYAPVSAQLSGLGFRCTNDF